MKTAYQAQKDYHEGMREKGMRRMAVYLPDSIYRGAKVQAAKEGISMQQLVQATLSDYVIREGKKRE